MNDSDMFKNKKNIKKSKKIVRTTFIVFILELRMTPINIEIGIEERVLAL